MLTYLGTGRGRAILVRARDLLLDTIYPPRCLTCPAETEAPHGLCPACWRDTHFLAGAGCFKCGSPIPGEAEEGDLCETCLRHPPAWDRGRAAVLYEGPARRAILAFKHGDRLDMAPALALWLQNAGAPLLARADLIAPVPLHWLRLIRRRYNQSAELARALGGRSGVPVAADLLLRTRKTIPQERMTRDERHANQADAIAVNPRRLALLRDRSVLLVDDVMTSGATLSASADACRAAGAARVDVLVVARVAFRDRDD
jgi:predicted amidophosphoribosyltransferase